MHFITTWMIVWLFVNGPIRVITLGIATGAGASSGRRGRGVGDWRAGVHPGDGAVARFGDCIIVVLPDDDAQREAVTELLALARQAAAAGVAATSSAASPGSGRPCPGRVAVAGAVAAVDDGVAVLVRGNVGVSLRKGTDTELLSGRDAVTWVDRIVDPKFDEAVVEIAGGGGQPHPQGDLAEGIVPGGGATLWPLATSSSRRPQCSPSSPSRRYRCPPRRLAGARPSPDFTHLLRRARRRRAGAPSRLGRGPAPSAEEEGPLVQGDPLLAKPLQRSQQPVLRHLRDLDGPPDPQPGGRAAAHWG